MSAWHQRRAVASALLSATHSAAHKQQVLRLEALAPALAEDQKNRTVLTGKGRQARCCDSMDECTFHGDSLLCLCIQNCPHRWWYRQAQEGEPGKKEGRKLIVKCRASQNSSRHGRSLWCGQCGHVHSPFGDYLGLSPTLFHNTMSMDTIWTLDNVCYFMSSRQLSKPNLHHCIKAVVQYNPSGGPWQILVYSCHPLTSLSIKSSTALPALTRRTMRRGVLSFDTMSSRDSAPMTLVPLASFWRKSCTLDTVLLNAHTWAIVRK